MLKNLLGGWTGGGEGDPEYPRASSTVGSTTSYSSGIPAVHRHNNNNNSKVVIPPQYYPTPLEDEEDDDGNGNDNGETGDERANRLLMQFPVYGTRSQAQHNHNLNQTADWLLGGTASIPSQQQLLLKQQQQQQQQEQQQQKEATVPSSDAEKQQQQSQQQGLPHSPTKPPVPVALPLVNRDWDEDEQALWKSQVGGPEPTTGASSTNDGGASIRWRDQEGAHRLSTTNAEGKDSSSVYSSSNTPAQPPMNDWLLAYYYHTGVTPKIQMTILHPMFDRGTTNGLRHSLPRSTFSGHTENATTAFASTSQQENLSSRHTIIPSDPEGEEDEDDDDDENDQDDPIILPNNRRHRPTPTAIGLGADGVVAPVVVSVEEEDRQHWMPDRLCKHCYACDTPFTVFRRRHHCRICGQVFCNSCSGYFVPAASQPGLLSSSGGGFGGLGGGSGSGGSGSNSLAVVATAGAASAGASPAVTPTTSTNKTILRACRMCYEQVTERQQILDEEEDAGRRRRKKEDTVLAGASPVSPRSMQSKLVASPTLQDQLEEQQQKGGGDASVLQNLSKKRTESSFAKRRMLSQQEALEREEKEHTSLLLQQQSQMEKTQIQLEAASVRDLRRTAGGVVMGSTTTVSPDFAVHKRMIRMASSGSSAGLNQETSNSHRSSTTTTGGGGGSRAEAVQEGNRHLGMVAASHLEQMGKALLASDAPLLFSELTKQTEQPKILYAKWISKLMTLATRCCATVEPNVKKGDLLDIRPYAKIKVIPGGTYQDCAYISGILFRKTVSHKRMAKEIAIPSIMLLSGGIEFTRTENRIASLETLMEQEGKYIEILVGKILKVKPDILLVGRAVSRKAQELLLHANVTLVQHVKSSLLNRISRQTGATIISSTDHIMNQFGAHVLGRCNRFRVIVARDNEVWLDETPVDGKTKATHREIQKLLNDPKLKNQDRQAALAANMLGEDIQDGFEAVKKGLAKRGVAQTYVMLEGCPKQLGCTVVLRGASRAALKQIKVVFRFLVNAAYNLRLETSFLKERCARVQAEYQDKPENLFSSSLCVDYGKAPSNRKIRPWNGGSNNEGSQRSISGQVTAFDHQSILISSVWMTEKTQCCPAEVKGICYYSQQDVSLGQFLRDSCFNLSLKCQNPSCKKSVLDHSLSFVHNDGLINIRVDHMDDALPPTPYDATRNSDGGKAEEGDGEENEDLPIATWTYCKNCAKVVTPLVYISECTWKYSFGKFLESFFYNRNLMMNSPQSKCSCQLQTSATLYFGCGRLAARFTYERVRPFGVFVRKSLPIELAFHRADALRQLEQISMSSSVLFVKFDKHIEKVSREARALYGNNGNRSEHLQTVLSELNRIGSEVDHAAKSLQEKIASVADKCAKENDESISDALLRFPWFARRYLFMLTSAWNEKLSAAGQAIVAMKKLASSSLQRSDSLVGPNVPAIVGDQNNDELHEGMRRLRQLHEVYSRYNITDITTVLPTIPGNNPKDEIDDDDFEDPDGAIDFTDGVDADVLASRRRLYQGGPGQQEMAKAPTKSLGTKRNEEPRLVREIPNSALTTAKVTPGGAVKSALTRFFNRGGRESDPYIVDLGIFSDGRPRLEPGVNGIVVPVIDEQLCTVIAYSLSSTEYANQFQGYSKTDAANAGTPSSGKVLEPPGGATSLEPSATGRNMNESHHSKSSHNGVPGPNDKQGIEDRMLVRNKSHIKHTFRDSDEKGQNLCKFVCTTYWATQFQAVRQAFLSPHGAKSAESNSFAFPSALDVEQAYVQSLSSAYFWAASGGKSGASFARTSDDRFVIKCISRTELQMFLESAPAYFEYLSKAFFHGLPTVLCKIVGVYQIGYHNRVTGKRSMDQVAVMQNIFYNKKITKTFDLKGSLRGRFAAQIQRAKDDHNLDTPTHGSDSNLHRKHGQESGSDGEDDSDSSDQEDSPTGSSKQDSGTLLDGDFLEFTTGRPMPMNDRAKAIFHMSILNDTLFLSIINVLDYSILVGIDEEKMELVVGIIDFMRQYDILKQMERVGKSLPMVVGSEAPTIIQPPLYKARFTTAMERYFMTVPSKWTTI